MNLERYKIQARVAKAFSHESRLMMLDALKDRDLCVCELTELLGADPSTVSRHLSILKEVGIVEDRKEGNKVFYHLKTPGLLSFFAYAQGVIRNRLKNFL